MVQRKSLGERQEAQEKKQSPGMSTPPRTEVFVRRALLYYSAELLRSPPCVASSSIPEFGNMILGRLEEALCRHH